MTKVVGHHRDVRRPAGEAPGRDDWWSPRHPAVRRTRGEGRDPWPPRGRPAEPDGELRGTRASTTPTGPVDPRTLQTPSGGPRAAGSCSPGGATDSVPHPRCGASVQRHLVRRFGPESKEVSWGSAPSGRPTASMAATRLPWCSPGHAPQDAGGPPRSAGARSAPLRSTTPPGSPATPLGLRPRAKRTDCASWHWQRTVSAFAIGGVDVPRRTLGA